MHYALVSRCFEVFVNKGKKINKFNKSKSSAMDRWTHFNISCPLLFRK